MTQPFGNVIVHLHRPIKRLSLNREFTCKSGPPQRRL
jgi:hypothetical protein